MYRYVILIQLGRGLNGLLGEFGMAAFSATHAHCIVAIHVHYIPYFIFNNKNPCHASCFASVYLELTVEFNHLFQIDRLS